MSNEELVLLIQHSEDKKEHLAELYEQNRGLIAKIANKYSAFFEMEDLMQEGCIALMEAAASYKENLGASFTHYAAESIRFHLLNYLRDHGNIVRFPAHIQEKLHKLWSINDSFYKRYGHEPSIMELAEHWDITPEEVKKLLCYSRQYSVKSMNEVISTDDLLELQDSIADPEDHMEEVVDRIEQEQLQKILWAIVDDLEEIQAIVIRKKYEDNQSTKDIADSLGCTIANVRTIEYHAMRELRKSRIKKQLKPFFHDDKIYSLSLQFGGYRQFINTWTSAPEKAVILAEEARK